MSGEGHEDMSSAWLAHAPPPPPPSATSVRKPRRSSSYEPLVVQKGILSERSTQGGYLPPSSHSPEPDRPRRTSISGAGETSATSAPVSPVKRARSKVTSNPPAPSAFYNYQHQLQLQQQQSQPQQQLYQQQPYQQHRQQQQHQPQQTQSPGYPSSVSMAYTQSESPSTQDLQDYARDRRGSAPAPYLPHAYPQQQPASYDYASQYQPTLPQPPGSYAPHPAAAAMYAGHAQQSHDYTQQYYATQPQSSQAVYSAMQPQWPQHDQSQGVPQHYFPPAGYAPAPAAQQPFDPHAYYATPAQQHSYSGHALPQLQQAEGQPFPTMDGVSPAPPPLQTAYVTDLSRQSTASSTGSVRRPLPQPTRASSVSSASGSPAALASRGSVRRDLPRPPPGAPATISAASMHSAAGSSASPGSPVAGSVRLPPNALNRTESVRMAAEALMARGAPQRRSLRSALGSSTFSPPNAYSRLTGTSPAAIESSQSEPSLVAATSGPGASSLQHAYNYDVARALPSPAPDAAPSSSAHHQPSVDAVVNSRSPARYQDALHQATSPARSAQPVTDLADSFGKVTVTDAVESQQPDHSLASKVPTFSFSADEPFEQPRRRRGSSVSRNPPAKVVQQEAIAPGVPTINLPGDDDDFDDSAGPVIAVSGPDDGNANGSGPQISITADDDDSRSQTSSKGPSISVSFSAERTAKSQRAGTSQAASSGSHSRVDSEAGRASSTAVGNGSGCYACRKWIAGKVVHALDSTFHPGCFVCAHCSEGLEHVAFYEHDGLPYCHFDYHELFSKRCFHCRTPIVDERYITVQDEELTGQDGETKERCYHELHFFCANCGDPFMDPKAAGSAAGSDPALMTADENGKIRHGGMEFIVHKGYPYCEKCHISLHKPRCKQCKKPILDDLISALGSRFHPHCFQCAACAQPFSQTQFFVKDGLPYDQECYKILLRNMV